MTSIRVLVIQTNKERKELNRYLDLPEFYKIVLNRAESVVSMEGLRVTEVWFTYDVMTNGMDRDLFEVLYHNLIFISTKPSDGFKLLA